jgi:hypothetical protein
MHNVRITPNKSWQICFRPVFAGKAMPPNISIQGVSRKNPPVPGKPLVDNREFSARIKFVWAARGCACAHIVFRDNDPATPYLYTVSGDDLGEFFTGVTSGGIPTHSDGFDVRLTFVKKGTQLFVRPIF